MPWWGWIVVGGTLLVAELAWVDAAFYLVFLGVSAIAVGLVGLAPLALPVWAQWLLFAALAAASMLALRGRLYAQLRPPARGIDEPLIGELVVAREEIAAGGLGSAELRGSTWRVRNTGSRALARGEGARVDSVEGLQLAVTPED